MIWSWLKKEEWLAFLHHVGISVPQRSNPWKKWNCMCICFWIILQGCQSHILCKSWDWELEVKKRNLETCLNNLWAWAALVNGNDLSKISGKQYSFSSNLPRTSGKISHRVVDCVDKEPPTHHISISNDQPDILDVFAAPFCLECGKRRTHGTAL